MSSGIYKIRNIVNDKCYIGSAANIAERWKLHKRQLASNNHHSILLQRAWNKYGEENFKFEVLLTCEKEELLQYEQLHFDELKPEYNILKVAGSPLGYKHRAESVLKMSESHKGMQIWLGKKHSEESKNKMSISAKNNPQSYWQDKTLSEEHKEKIANAHIGLKQSEETVAKRVAKNTGQKRSDESRAKMSAAQKSLNKKLSEEQKLDISKIQTGRKQSVESSIKKSLAMKNTLALRNIIRNWGCAL